MNLSEEDQRKILESQRDWLTKLSRFMTRDSSLQNDLAQEGWIEMWKSLKSYDPEKGASLLGWLHFKAKGKMLSHFRSSPREVPTESEVLDSSGLETQVEMAYHSGEIHKAIEHLTPREQEYIRLRYWAGYNLGDLTRHFGYEPSGLQRTSKIKLLQRLSHLRGE